MKASSTVRGLDLPRFYLFIVFGGPRIDKKRWRKGESFLSTKLSKSEHLFVCFFIQSNEITTFLRLISVIWRNVVDKQGYRRDGGISIVSTRPQLISFLIQFVVKSLKIIAITILRIDHLIRHLFILHSGIGGRQLGEDQNDIGDDDSRMKGQEGTASVAMYFKRSDSRFKGILVPDLVPCKQTESPIHLVINVRSCLPAGSVVRHGRIILSSHTPGSNFFGCTANA